MGSLEVDIQSMLNLNKTKGLQIESWSLIFSQLASVYYFQSISYSNLVSFCQFKTFGFSLTAFPLHCGAGVTAYEA